MSVTSPDVLRVWRMVKKLKLTRLELLRLQWELEAIQAKAAQRKPK